MVCCFVKLIAIVWFGSILHGATPKVDLLHWNWCSKGQWVQFRDEMDLFDYSGDELQLDNLTTNTQIRSRWWTVIATYNLITPDWFVSETKSVSFPLSLIDNDHQFFLRAAQITNRRVNNLHSLFYTIFQSVKAVKISVTHLWWNLRYSWLEIKRTMRVCSRFIWDKIFQLGYLK
jgi:hypothetical protein